MDELVTARGLFLVLEGGEGVGKSTQARMLGEWLSRREIPHRVSREPGGTPLGESVRGVLLGGGSDGMPAEAELLLMLAARAAYVRELVTPALARGEIVISDRYELSSLAYQGAGRGLGVELVERLNDFATGGVRPDLTIVLDLPAPEGRARQTSEGKEHDRIEGEGLEFLGRVTEAYRSLAGRDSRTVLMDGSGSPEEVHERVIGLLTSRFPEPFSERGG